MHCERKPEASDAVACFCRDERLFSQSRGESGMVPSGKGIFMNKQRPTAVTVMGILNIIFGALFLLCFLCSGASLLMQMSGARMGGGGLGDANDPTAQMWNFMKTEIPGFMAVQVASLVVHLLLTLLLLMSGIGLLNMQGWARIGSIFYAITSILVEIASLFYQLVYVNPAMNRWLQRELQRIRVPGAPPAPDVSFFATAMNVGSIIGAVILVSYGVVLLIMMLLPKVSAAFAGGGRVETYKERDEEYYDEGFERRRREDWSE